MKIQIYDTTLRDGTQCESVAFSVEDKLQVARKLDELGIDYIEGGWPGSNDKDAEFFRKASALQWNSARLAAFGSTAHPRNLPADDPNLRALLEANTGVLTIFGKSWDFHVTTALKITLAQNCELIRTSVAYLKSAGREVIYDAEHFFDGFAANPDYALATLRAAEEGGAGFIVLCDTNGGSLTSRIEEGIERAKATVKTPLGIHTHNDSELAVANSLAAVSCGVVQVQGTINGYGERCGNANLCSIIPNLELKMGYETIGRERLPRLAAVSKFVSQMANLPHRKELPYVGGSAFAHKGGIHVSAVIKDAATYEHVAPEMVGNARRVLVSELSGRSNLAYKAREMEMNLQGQDEAIKHALRRLKKLEHEGYEFEAAEGSLRVLLETAVHGEPEFFTIDNFRVVSEMRRGGEFSSEATVKIRVGDGVVHTAAEGDGPVHALDTALHKALHQFFEPLRAVRLTDYKVRVLEAGKGTAAKVRVLIQQTDGEESWTTVGVSENILEASYAALADGVRYKLLKHRGTPDHALRSTLRFSTESTGNPEAAAESPIAHGGPTS
ncbi:MAG TPA: citramalate synthase [Acidobacteriota bacterium]|nr:citramalate synthase [Acidobacteriota bacterium]